MPSRTVDLKTSEDRDTSMYMGFGGNSKMIKKGLKMGANAAIIGSVLLIIAILVFVILIYHEVHESREILAGKQELDD